MYAKRGASLPLLVVLACVSLGVLAQATPNRSILVLVKNVPGAPTPAQVVDYCNTWPHAVAPPLQAFNTKDPEAGYLLLPDRATGDFRAWLQANPNSVRRKLEDYVVTTFPLPTDIPEALAALRADPYVEAADVPLAMEFHAGSPAEPSLISAVWPSAGTQYGRDVLGIDAAWQLTGGGYALVAQIDAGLRKEHPALRQFLDNGIYFGGNFIEAASKDVGLTGEPPQNGFNASDVDEAKSMFISAGACTEDDAYLPPAHLGHGTHVAGLLSANGASGQGIQGTCKHCGIAAYRNAFLQCYDNLSPPQVWPNPNASATERAKTEAIDTAASVLSMSFGAPNNGNSINCTAYRTFPRCLTLAYAKSRDVSLVASSGNQREAINFPASDKRVIAAGGFQSDLALWDDSPGNSTNCPASPYTAQCGSNRSQAIGGFYVARQELLGSSKRVLSTTYPGTTWVDQMECGDGYGTPMGDGIGWCTGTSMSAPQIAGLVGLLRTVSPLVPTSEPEPAAGTAPGLRTVLAQTASQARAGQPWNPYVGYGIPDAAAAARKMLGIVAGATVRNRVTPLFRLYDGYSKDFAETTSPQAALSLMIAQVHNYAQPSTGLGAQPAVPGYAFPYDDNDPNDSDDPYEATPAAPRAAIYVLTTDMKPRNEWPALIPLHQMDKPKANGRDYLLVTTVADIEAAHVNGYNLRTI